MGGEVEGCEEESIADADGGCGEHAWEGGAEEAEDEAGEEAIGHEAGVVLAGVEFEPSGVVEWPE